MKNAPTESLETLDPQQYVEDMRGDDNGTSRPKFKFLTTQDILNLSPPSWLVENVLPAGGLACLYAPPGTGKSFLALDLGLSVAHGTSWHGLAVKRGPVIYVAAEGGRGLSRRIQAWTFHFQSGEGREIPFFACLEPPQFVVGQVTGGVSDFLGAINRQIPKPPVFVVLDTLARCLVRGDENSAKDVGLLIEGCDKIRRETGATVLLVHHANKSGDLRGSTALLGGVDTNLAVTKEGSTLQLSCEKQKDAEPFKPMEFDLRPVAAGEDPEGKPTTSCVITAKIGWQQGALLQGSVAATFEALRGASLQEGLTTSEWLKVSEQKERTFYRNRKLLIDQGYVTRDGEGRGARFLVTKDITANCHDTAT